ncbi:MAG: tRNA uridine-5-carboxymethylaminomethyl(34) synthesis GTPase MnmE [Candidatus Omnitrophota bacterium]|nr:MAG: tRNA uridine-5-carboxymethylaminomethyl(34) synthesis GTPase MnmE [Candidatus Omnitrophota bacterium]
MVSVSVDVNIEDTIAAISTPLGQGGIGIVRISGKCALKIADKIFRSKKKVKPSQFDTFTLHYGVIIGKNLRFGEKNEIIDQVLLTVMRGPHTYTCQDVVEINCHGGIVPLSKILEITLQCGARMANPGEFTQRAFLNGRIDLLQAEAVLNIITAKTDLALHCAMGQLQGMVSDRIHKLRDGLIELAAPLEALLDFPDQEIARLPPKKIIKILEHTIENIKSLINSAERGMMLQNGINVVISGSPNVGKSSLMNRFVDYERVIVTHISGTTRDVVEEIINIDGLPVKIFDTAGIMESECLITQKSVIRSFSVLEKADLVLYMFDASKKISESELQTAKKLKHKKVIIVLNKIDKPENINITRVKNILTYTPIVKISALNGLGISELKKQIVKYFFSGKILQNDEIIITNMRHKQILQRCLTNITNGLEIARNNGYDECLVFEIRQALDTLGEITGENVSEDILDNIFGRFCIGK